MSTDLHGLAPHIVHIFYSSILLSPEKYFSTIFHLPFLFSTQCGLFLKAATRSSNVYVRPNMPKGIFRPLLSAYSLASLRYSLKLGSTAFINVYFTFTYFALIAKFIMTISFSTFTTRHFKLSHYLLPLCCHQKQYVHLC